MRNSLYLRVMQDINDQHYTIDEILSKFYVDSISDLLSYLTQTFEESCDELVVYPGYVNNYHCFLLNLTEAINNAEDLELLAVYIKKHISAIKSMIKPYNKKQKDKDELFNKLNRIKNELEGNYNITMNKAIDIYDDDNSKILKFIIFELKDPNALYHIIDNHREIVNMYIHDEHLLSYIIRYVLQNIDELSDEDIDYYKRVITMILIRDELKIDELDLEDVMEELEIMDKKEDDNKKKHLKYIKYIIDNHFELKNKDNTIYNELIPVKIPTIGTPVEERVDLRKLQTFTIDFVKYATNFNMLFDDAFSMQQNPNGTYFIYIHIPDVDEYIPRDKELNKYMKEMCESRYIKHNTEPMIPYRIARNLSLIKDKDRLSLTTRIHVDEEGNILNIHFMKSIIRVDDNFSINRADILLRDNMYEYNWLLDMMYKMGKKLRSNRDETIGRRGKAAIICDEFNIWSNIATASYFNETGLPFAFKNFLSEDYKSKYLGSLRRFLNENNVDEDSRNLLYDLSEAKSRTFYSTTNEGNAKFNGLPYCNIGNPLREYISLETDRLIKDLVIDKLGNNDYWLERIENDCIEQSEGVQKVKELYKTNY
ncbi:MAG: RNB domain-containing ribonuclease [Bacilli bacterium]|nr:RNB domain-containing ribonuclease [Bacilli bacterium]